MLNKEISFDNFKDEVSPGVFRKIRYALWLLVSNIFFLTNIPYPSKFKVLILKSFGCRIGDKVVIKPWVKIKFPWMLTVGNSVWFGESVTVMSGVTVGHGAVVATNSHVFKDVEPYSIVGGNPAKFIKYRFDKEIIDALLEMKWWDLPDSTINKILPLLQLEPTMDIINQMNQIIRSEN